MSETIQWTTSGNTSASFNGVVAPQPAGEAPPRKRPAPFSLRLSADEKERLMRDAAGQPLGAYIKSILFAPSGKGAASRALIDQNRTLLAQILATLGSSGIGEGLSELARTVDGGTLRDDDLHAVLNKAESELSEIRVLLLKALGLRGNSK